MNGSHAFDRGIKELADSSQAIGDFFVWLRHYGLINRKRVTCITCLIERSG